MADQPETFDEDLPAYSSLIVSPNRPHVYELLNRQQLPWLSVKISSRSKSPDSLPTFFRGDKIIGSVDLNLDSAETILAVDLKVSRRALEERT